MSWVLMAACGCGDPCLRACRHVFDDCGLSTASSEAACELQCTSGTSSACANASALQECYGAATCESLKSGAAEAQCASACGS